MDDYSALLADLTARAFWVYSMRQEDSGGWSASMQHRSPIEGPLYSMGGGLTPYLALDNARQNMLWRIANPPNYAKGPAKGSLDELLSIVRAAPAYEALSPADVKSLKL